MKWLLEFVSAGGLIQLNASSAVGAFGYTAKRQWNRMVRRGLVHFIASDAHNETTRPPQISPCIKRLQKYCSEERLQDLIWNHADRVMRDESI